MLLEVNHQGRLDTRNNLKILFKRYRVLANQKEKEVNRKQSQIKLLDKKCSNPSNKFLMRVILRRNWLTSKISSSSNLKPTKLINNHLTLMCQETSKASHRPYPTNDWHLLIHPLINVTRYSLPIHSNFHNAFLSTNMIILWVHAAMSSKLLHLILINWNRWRYCTKKLRNTWMSRRRWWTSGVFTKILCYNNSTV